MAYPTLPGLFDLIQTGSGGSSDPNRGDPQSEDTPESSSSPFGAVGNAERYNPLVRGAQAWRGFWDEHPVAAIGSGFVPFLGQGLGIIDAGAAYLDPEASKTDVGLATAGVLPWGKVIGKGKGVLSNITIGRRGQDALAAAGKSGKVFNRQSLTDPGDVAEILDRLDKIDYEALMYPPGGLGDTAVPVKLGELLKDEDLYTAYPELRDLPVTLQRGGAGGGSFSAGSSKRDSLEHAKMRIGTVGATTRDFIGRETAEKHKETVTNTLFHEIQHAIQQLEGTWDKRWLGGNRAREGSEGYNFNPGEVMARVSSARSTWSQAQREAVPLSQHYKAEIVRGLDELKGIEAPEATGQFAADSLDVVEGIKARAARFDKGDYNKEFLKSVYSKTPKWEDVGPTRAGAFVVEYAPDTYVEGGIRQYSEKFKPDRLEVLKWQSKIWKGQELPPITVKVRSIKGVPDELEIADISQDDLARLEAIYQTYGRGAAVKIKYHGVDANAKEIIKNDPTAATYAGPPIGDNVSAQELTGAPLDDMSFESLQRDLK